MNKKLLGAGVGVLLGALGTLGCGSDTPANLYTQLTNTQEDAVALRTARELAGESPRGWSPARSLGASDVPGIRWDVRRGTGKKAGYVIHITGPAPVRLALSAPQETDR